MFTYSAAFLAAVLIASGATPLVRYLALRIGAVSMTGGRHINQKEIPRLGGLAIATAVILPLFAMMILRSEVARVVRSDSLMMLGLALGALVMCLLGVLDDTRGVKASYKLVVQILCATVAYLCGFQIHAVSLPLVGITQMGFLALPLTVLWIVGITNAVNLIDGLDGLAAGVVFCAAGTNLVVAMLNGSVFIALTMATLMGSLLGFLFYNFNPAKIFMGDSGSYFLGFVIATASLAGNQKASTAVALLVPILALGVPIFDTLFSIVRRTLEQRPIFSPDRGHIHHRLLDLGLTHRRSVLFLYSLSLLFAALAVVVSIGRSWEIGAALATAVVLVVGLIKFVRYFDLLNRSSAEEPSDELVSALRKQVPLLLREDPDQSERASLRLLDSLPGVQSIALCSEEFQRGGSPQTRRFTGANPLLFLEVVLSNDTQLSPASEMLFQIVADHLLGGLARDSADPSD